MSSTAQQVYNEMRAEEERIRARQNPTHEDVARMTALGLQLLSLRIALNTGYGHFHEEAMQAEYRRTVGRGRPLDEFTPFVSLDPWTNRIRNYPVNENYYFTEPKPEPKLPKHKAKRSKQRSNRQKPVKRQMRRMGRLGQPRPGF